MRLLLAAIAIASASPALAQQTLAEQVTAARQIFMSGLAADAYREGAYYELVVDGIDGTYVELSSMIDQADAAGIRRQQDAFCSQNPFTVTATPPFGLFITRGADEKIQYTYTGGATFVPALDVIGFARGNQSARGSAATDLLKRVSEPVSIWRPSPDVFVISGRDVPDVFVRCTVASVQKPLELGLPPTDTEPETDAGIVPDLDGETEAAQSGLEIALGKVFEREFGEGLPKGKAAFVACAAPVFAPLSEDDLALVIESGFAPAEADRKRLEEQIPGLGASLAACAEEAGRATE